MRRRYALPKKEETESRIKKQPTEHLTVRFAAHAAEHSAGKRFQEKHIGRAISMNLIRENVIQGVYPKTIYTRHI